MKKIEQILLFCKHEQKVTSHYTEIKKPNWPLHIVLTLLTGAWLVVCLYLALVSNKKQKWKCIQCGMECYY